MMKFGCSTRRSGKPLPLANGQEKDRIYDGKPRLTVV